MDIKKIVENKLNLFPKLYNELQIFGPLTDEKLIEKKGACLLNNSCLLDNKCDNCVAIRSLITNTTISKYEEYDGNPIQMTATPIELDEKKYVVELFRNLNEYDIKSLGLFKEDVLTHINNLNYELMHDSLTGTFNRRYMDEKLPFIILDCLKRNSCISIVMTDIDHFKNVNDSYGHQAGDEVLRTFTSIIKTGLYIKDSWVCRYGGEEFLLVMPDTSLEEATYIVDSIRKEYENTSIRFKNNVLKSTASFGIISSNKMLDDENSLSDQLIQAADQCLYDAKEKGRNCLVSKEYTNI